MDDTRQTGAPCPPVVPLPRPDGLPEDTRELLALADAVAAQTKESANLFSAIIAELRKRQESPPNTGEEES